MAVTNQPTNRNYLSPLGYKFVLSRAPNVEYFVQRVTLPGVNLPATSSPNPFVKIPLPGDHLDYDTLQITFKVNENLDNYLEIYNWMVSLGKPEKFSQYDLQNRPYRSLSDQTDTVVSDITVTILSSAMNANIEFNMRDCFPVTLSSLDMDSTLTDVEYLEATASFAVRDFTISRI